MNKHTKHQLILKGYYNLDIRSSEIYISGPITGIQDLNRPAFNNVATQLKEKGYIPINPLDIFTEEEQKLLTWDMAMRSDIKHLLPCGACVMLPGWQGSTGAVFEFITSKTLNIPVVNLDFDLLYVTNHDLRQLFEKIITKIDETDFQQMSFKN